MGSILEGLLLHEVEYHPASASQARRSPKDPITGKPKPFHEWGLSVLIDVAHELGWLEGDVSRFSHALRESRNTVHPYVKGPRPIGRTVIPVRFAGKWFVQQYLTCKEGAD